MKKYDMGGSLQSLLPLLDLAAPGLGTAASTVAGVLQQANAFTKQSTPLKSPTNPFRTYRDGGKVDPEKPKTYSGGTLPEATIKAKASELQKLRKEYMDKNPKDKYIADYLKSPLASGTGNSIVNYPKRLDVEYQKKMDEYVKKSILIKSFDEAVANEIKQKGSVASTLPLGIFSSSVTDPKYLPKLSDDVLKEYPDLKDAHNTYFPQYRLTKLVEAGYPTANDKAQAYSTLPSLVPGPLGWAANAVNVGLELIKDKPNYGEAVLGTISLGKTGKKGGMALFKAADKFYDVQDMLPADSKLKMKEKKRMGGSLKEYDLPTHEQGGGSIKVGNNEFDPKDIRASKKGNYFIGKDKNTGESFGLVFEDGKYRYKKSTDKSKLNVTTGKDYESLKPVQPTTEADLKKLQDNTAAYFKELYNSPFYKRNQPSSVANKNLSTISKYEKNELLADPVLAPKGFTSRVHLPEKEKRGIIMIDPTAPKYEEYFKGASNRGTMTHEFSHVIGETKKDLDLINSKLNRSNVRDPHDEMPEEMKADIDALRRSMKDNGVWDMKSNFNQQHLDNYRKLKPDNFNLNRIKLLTKSDADMLQLMNSVSYVDNKPELPMARKGGLLPQLKFGGKLKEHNLPSHEQGGGLVDKMGNPSLNGVAEIEKQESIYTKKKGDTPYVFSDTLLDSNGKTFSQNAKAVTSKFKGKDQISKATNKKLMEELVVKNEIAKKMQEQVETPQATQMPNGGELTLNNPLLPKLGQFKYPSLKVPGQLQPMQQTETLVQDMTPTTTGTAIQGNNTTPSFDLKLTPSGNSVNRNPLGSLDLGKVGGILKGVALAGSAIDAFQKPEEEQLRVPDFSKGDKAYTGLGGSFDPIRNDIVQQAKSGENQIMQSSGNFGQVMSRLNALQAGVGRNLAQVGLQEKQYNDQIGMQKGQREDQKAGITASEQIRKQTADSQNKAMKQDLVANLLQNINNYGTEFMKQDTIAKELKSLDKQAQRDFLTQLSLLNIKNPNFQIDKDLINSDNPLSALKFIN